MKKIMQLLIILISFLIFFSFFGEKFVIGEMDLNANLLRFDISIKEFERLMKEYDMFSKTTDEHKFSGKYYDVYYNEMSERENENIFKFKICFKSENFLDDSLAVQDFNEFMQQFFPIMDKSAVYNFEKIEPALKIKKQQNEPKVFEYSKIIRISSWYSQMNNGENQLNITLEREHLNKK